MIYHDYYSELSRLLFILFECYANIDDRNIYQQILCKSNVHCVNRTKYFGFMCKCYDIFECLKVMTTEYSFPNLE